MNDIDYLKHYAKLLGVDKISAEILNDQKFLIWSGSGKSQQHHYGDGGLLKHTKEVVELCLNNSKYYKNLYYINQKILFCAALFHDWGKIYDYKKTDIKPYEWTSTEHKRLIHHISKSAIMWSKTVEKTGECKDIEEQVLHCILSHHGQREWGFL